VISERPFLTHQLTIVIVSRSMVAFRKIRGRWWKNEACLLASLAARGCASRLIERGIRTSGLSLEGAKARMSEMAELLQHCSAKTLRNEAEGGCASHCHRCCGWDNESDTVPSESIARKVRLIARSLAASQIWPYCARVSRKTAVIVFMDRFSTFGQPIN